MNYIEPKPLAKCFTCPHCGAISQQQWWARSWSGGGDQLQDSQRPLRVGLCTHCRKNTLWVQDSMVFPDTGNAPNPNVEMSEEVRRLYLEAAAIRIKSPRGAAALLRLAVQVLCVELGGKGKNINDDIKFLVAKGLPVVVQQSLDVVRVTGNDAVHPGLIDTDDPQVVARLFDLLNIIVEYMIAMPKRVSGIYASLAPDTHAAIAKRDSA